MSGKPKIARVSNEQIAELLEKSGGQYTPVAQSLGIAISTISRRVENSPKLRQVVQDQMDLRVDFAEGKLFDNISKGDNTAIIFYLKCHGKRKGYVDSQNVAVSFDAVKFVDNVPEPEDDGRTDSQI